MKRNYRDPERKKALQTTVKRPFFTLIELLVVIAIIAIRHLNVSVN